MMKIRKQLRTYLLSNLLLILLICCNNKNGNPSISQYGDKAPVQSKQETLQKKDPYFVLVKDTISLNGPQNITRNILCDNKGKLWFASWEGLICFDGKHYINITLKKNLLQFHVFSVMEDSKGIIWFGTIGGGLYRYNPEISDNSFENAFTLFTIESGLGSNLIFSLAEDKKGNIWIGTSGGLNMYDGNKFYSYTETNGLNSNSVNALLADQNNTLWIGTNTGLNYFQLDSKHESDAKFISEFKDVHGASFRNVRCLAAEQNGNILIAHQDGLTQYILNKKMWLRSIFLHAITLQFTGNVFCR